MNPQYTPIFLPIKERIKLVVRKAPAFIDKRPLLAFFSLLGILLLLIVLSSFLRKGKVVEKKAEIITKSVRVYSIGSAPKIRVQAQIEKTGVIQINSIASGVIQDIKFKPGQAVNKGDILTVLSTNYQGGNALAVQSQIAYAQYRNTSQSFPLQQELIAKQKELAQKTDLNADELRRITAASLDETRSLIGLNNDILGTLDKNLRQYESTNSAGLNDQAILSTKQLKSQFQSANNQLNNQLRSNEYQAGENNPPAQMSDLQREITIKQLEIQEKTLALNKEITGLQFRLAKINESIMYPAAPFSGVVQRVFVKVGQAVNPGTPLMIIAQTEDDPIVAIAYVPREIAQKTSVYEPSTLYLGSNAYSTTPSYITQDAIQGTLYGIYFDVPDNYNRFVTEKGYIYIDLPIGYFDTIASIPYIPIDVVYQTQDSSYVYVIENGKVQSRTVTLGPVYGSYVEVESGLDKGDQIILDRNVITGDLVSVQTSSQ